MRLALISDLGIDKAGSKFATFVGDTRLEDTVVRIGKIKLSILTVNRIYSEHNKLEVYSDF